MTSDRSWVRCELHCHTVKSHDGYTSIDDLIEMCVARRITAVAIMEHDRIEITDEERAKCRCRGIELIAGCEATSQRGAHLGGLFLQQAVTGGSVQKIVDQIEEQGGLVSIPHPFKPDSGLFSHHPPNSSEAAYVLRHASFMELVNGGWNSAGHRETIRSLAERYHVTLIAASDSHKPWHVGQWVTEFAMESDRLTASAMRQAEVRLLRFVSDSSLSAGTLEPARNQDDGIIQKCRNTRLYQLAVRGIPRVWKRYAKLALYRRQCRIYRQTGPSDGIYEEVDDKTRLGAPHQCRGATGGVPGGKSGRMACS